MKSHRVYGRSIKGSVAIIWQDVAISMTEGPWIWWWLPTLMKPSEKRYDHNIMKVIPALCTSLMLCSLWGSRQSCWAVNLLHATAPIYQVVEFFFLLELCFCNAPVIWKAKSAHRISAEKFRLHVVHYLLEGYESGVSQRRGNRTEEPPQKGWC